MLKLIIHDCCAVGPSSLCRGDKGGGVMRSAIGTTCASTLSRSWSAGKHAKSVQRKRSLRSTKPLSPKSLKLSLTTGKLLMPGRVKQLYRFSDLKASHRQKEIFSVFHPCDPNVTKMLLPRTVSIQTTSPSSTPGSRRALQRSVSH